MTPRYTDDELRDALREYADREHDGRAPTVPETDAADDLPSASTFVYHFGSWNAALAAAGLDTRHRHRSDDELITDLRAFIAETRAYPTCEAVADAEEVGMDMATPQTYINRFGSWRKALRAAGLPAFAATRERDGEGEHNVSDDRD